MLHMFHLSHMGMANYSTLLRVWEIDFLPDTSSLTMIYKLKAQFAHHPNTLHVRQLTTVLIQWIAELCKEVAV